MRSQKRQYGAILLLGGLLGFGVASYRNRWSGPTALAAEAAEEPGKAKQPQPGGVFSPPGSSDSGPVVPAPGEPPFKGKIGRTGAESVPYWPPQPTAPRGSPNVAHRLVLEDERGMSVNMEKAE